MGLWVVTGGAGFIGSAFVRKALKEKWVDKILVLDALTYAGNLDNLEPVKDHPGFSFLQGNICSEKDVRKAFAEKPEAVFHFAAESHVDRSIESSQVFYQTNILGTALLLELSRAHGIKRFLHVSTDEVYGSLSLESPELFTEKSPLDPTSPYAASKAASDLLVLAEHKTFGTDCVITRCSNNFGPYQYPEKFIPLFLTKALEGEALPLYGNGKNIRDWIHVEAHVKGIHLAFEKGKSGEVYNLGGECERSNIEIAKRICLETGVSESSISFVEDRKSHDLRYAIDASRAKMELGFSPGPKIEDEIESLTHWYQKHTSWLAGVRERIQA